MRQSVRRCSLARDNITDTLRAPCVRFCAEPPFVPSGAGSRADVRKLRGGKISHGAPCCVRQPQSNGRAIVQRMITTRARDANTPGGAAAPLPATARNERRRQAAAAAAVLFDGHDNGNCRGYFSPLYHWRRPARPSARRRHTDRQTDRQWRLTGHTQSRANNIITTIMTGNNDDDNTITGVSLRLSRALCQAGQH